MEFLAQLMHELPTVSVPVVLNGNENIEYSNMDSFEQKQCAKEYHSNDFEWEEKALQCRLAARNQPIVSLENSDLSLAEAAQEHWDTFHQLNKGKFYKPRNYLLKEFPELCLELEPNSSSSKQLLEVGCGYGSSIFPILKGSPGINAHVFDFSEEAISILKANPEYSPDRCNAFVCDVTNDDLEEIVGKKSMDFVLLVFAFSAMPPESFPSVIQKLYKVLRPGGLLMIRDYGLYDLAMMRSKKKIGENLYFRSDGTLAYFFSTENLRQYLTADGMFEEIENEYCTVRLRNRRKQVNMDRIWIHAKFRKI